MACQSNSLFCFKRNDHLCNVLESFSQLRDEESLLDCSIVCEGNVIKCHKLLLAASSGYFRAAFVSLNTPCQSTAVIIKDMPFDDLKIIIDFIYKGEITVEQIQVPSLIKSAEALEVSGLHSSEPTFMPGNNAMSAINLQKILPTNLSKSSSARESNATVQQANNLAISSTPPIPVTISQEPSDAHSPNLITSQKTREGSPSSYMHCDYSSDEIEIPSHCSKASAEIEYDRADSQLSDDGYRIVVEEEEGDESRAGNDKVIDLSSSGSETNAYEHKKLLALKMQQESAVAAHHQARNNIDTTNGAFPRGNQMAFPRNFKFQDSTVNYNHSQDSAQAVAAQTTLAMVSNFLSNQALPAHSKENASSIADAYTQLLNENLYKVRGRGRPPRYSFDEDPKVKSYKVRPILPALPNLMPPSLLLDTTHSQQHEPLHIKRAKITHSDPYLARGRKPKASVPPSREVNGKNKCPHCPQVYYSTQAMNDHVNNVHSLNAQKYTCRICAKEFSWKISLNKHMRKLHNDETTALDAGQRVNMSPPPMDLVCNVPTSC